MLEIYLEKPVIEIPPEKVIAHSDEIREVECVAKEGNPLPTFSWEYKEENAETSWIPWNSEVRTYLMNSGIFRTRSDI